MAFPVCSTHADGRCGWGFAISVDYVRRGTQNPICILGGMSKVPVSIMQVPTHLHVKGAREHNLKNLELRIPRGKLVVVTGPSGSGKSSLAFDTIYAEGQRRYVESLSAYARQFLGQMEKPQYDYIRGLAPTISIEQKAASKNPRSTVGTITEIYDYLRVLFARVGHQHCHQCDAPVSAQSAEQMVNAILQLPEGTRILVLAPQVVNRKGEHAHVFSDALKTGFARVRVNGEDMGIDRKSTRLNSSH